MVVNFTGDLRSTKVNFGNGKINNNYSTKPLQQDTVELSSQTKKEKTGMPKSLKWALGIGGTGLAVYGALVTHRALSKPSLEAIKKDLSEVLRRNMADDEIKDMLGNYKNIMKIKDKKEFCQKAFEQVKKDYGYKDLDIQVTLNDTTDTIFGGMWLNTGENFLLYYNKIIEICGGKFNKQTKAQLLDVIFHEFQHAKQTEYCMRTNPEKYFEALVSDKIMTPRYIEQAEKVLSDESLIKQCAAIQKQTPEEYRKALERDLAILKEKGYKALPDCVKQVEAMLVPIKERLNNLFGKFEKFAPGSKEYELGEKYIKNYGEYVSAVKEGDNKEYLEQLIEVEARKAGNTSYEIPTRTQSIWNIFAPLRYKSVLN